MAGVKLKFSSSLSPSDPVTNPVVIIGTPKNLAKISYHDMTAKFGGRVQEDIFSSALNALQTSPDVCPLYLNVATISPLPAKCSRHNAPSRSHAITKCVRSAATSGRDSFVVIICEKQDVFPSAAAVARAYPLYSKKTNMSSKLAAASTEKMSITVTVEYFLLDNAIPLTEDECVMLERAAESVRTTARIVDTPCNEMNTDHFLEEIGVVAKELGIEPFIIRDKELELQGFGGIYGVGKAAPNPPALAVLSHLPKGATKTIAWVGKGIMYDTGGLSIKGKTAMPGMKRDCGGASGILGAFRLAVLTGFKENLHAVFCLAENSVGPLSTRPDDIHTLYSGRTVEINNTDAEGRLVLADGVFYAHKDLKADIILDMATLTGGQSVATGKHHAAVLTNNEHWENALVDAGLASGDLTFPIPFCPEFHFSEFNSAVADMKNSVADRSNALSSCAGLFILAHLGFDYPGTWMHVDMAAPVHCGERATGYGVALLVSLFGQYSKSALLQSIGPVLEESADESDESKRKKMRLN